MQQCALVLETQYSMEKKQKAQDYITGVIFIKLKTQQNQIKFPSFGIKYICPFYLPCYAIPSARETPGHSRCLKVLKNS